MHFFYCADIPGPGRLVELDSNEKAHLFRTLNAHEGLELGLIDGRGTRAVAGIISDKRIVVHEKSMLPEPGLKLELFVAPPRRVCMDLILKQCIETGAWAIHTFVAERSVALPVKKSIEQRWRKLMIEACKQSGNPFFPEINLPVSFKDAVDRVGRNGMKAYFGTPGRGKRELPCPPARVAWFVGPEGGFTSEEEDFMAKHGFTGLNIGRWTMRVETAAVCGTALFLF